MFHTCQPPEILNLETLYFALTPPHPQPSRQQIALGHYMTSYMKYMESKCPFVIVMRN